MRKDLPLLLGTAFFLSGCGSSSSTGGTEPPQIDGWAPQGARTAGTYSYEIIPEPDAFRAMHVGPNNSDNVWIAVAPELELDWTAETSFYCPEGPSFDNQGNLYFSPLFPHEDVSLVSLDAETGKRNWAIEAKGSKAGSGAVLILNDPDQPGEQIIYHATYVEAMALKPDGTEIWRVPTGLSLPPVIPGERSPTHSFGFNYHPRTDSVVAVTLGADILAFDRETGEQIASGKIPGAPAVSAGTALPPQIIEASDALTDEVFGKTPSGLSLYSVIVDVIFGGGSVVTNYFAIDPNSSRIYVAATAEDADDGTEDGLSELGAVYALDLVDDGNAGFRFEVLGSTQFDGGTGSTPSVSEDGSRVFVSDNIGNVIALDAELNELWRLDVGAPVAASIAVSPDNNELFAVTRSDVFKLTDEGDRGRLDWTASFDPFGDDPEIQVQFQALTPTIVANGVAVSIGGGKAINDRALMLRVGVGLLDRETGELASFAEGREESIAVTAVSPDGGIYTANSPVRRVSGKAIFPGLTKPVIGGISRYKPVRLDRLAHDASCAAAKRAANAATIADSAPGSAEQDIRQIQALTEQTRRALARAAADGDLEAAVADVAAAELDTGEANLTRAGLATAAESLLSVCVSLEPEAI